MSLPDCAACGEPVIFVVVHNHPGHPYYEFYCNECREFTGNNGVIHDFEAKAGQTKLLLRRKE